MNALTAWLQTWTMDGKLAILLFPLFAGLLLYTSLQLVKYSEVIIAKTRFGGGFVGGTLIAMVTSVPEMITEITQGSAGHPERGLGDDIGSNAFSLLLMAVGAIIFIRYMFLNSLGRWTKISLMISFALTATLNIFLIVNQHYGYADVPAPYIGIIPLLFFLGYLVTVGLSYRFADVDEPIDEEFIRKHSLRQSLVWFAIFALLLVAFAVMVNIDVNAFQNGLGIPSESAGGVFLAVTTSLPEIVAFFAFMKRRQQAAAIASLVGSHFFNLGIMFFGDLAYTPGPTFNNAAMADNLPLAVLTIIMLLVVIVHFLLARWRPTWFAKKSIYLVAPILVIVTYISGWALILTVLH